LDDFRARRALPAGARSDTATRHDLRWATGAVDWNLSVSGDERAMLAEDGSQALAPLMPVRIATLEHRQPGVGFHVRRASRESPRGRSTSRRSGGCARGQLRAGGVVALFASYTPDGTLRSPLCWSTSPDVMRVAAEADRRGETCGGPSRGPCRSSRALSASGWRSACASDAGSWPRRNSLWGGAICHRPRSACRPRA
jgi:hypothetical protein